MARGGDQECFTEKFADGVNEVSPYWPESRAHLEALAFLTVKYAFFHFSWHLFYKIYVDTLQNVCISEQNVKEKN